jgi:hypothetical protein
MSGQGKFWGAVDKRAKKINPAVASVGMVKSLSPFSISYNGLELSAQNGDTIYLNNLLLDEQKTFTQANPITCSQGTITENHTNIINNEITSWLSSVHGRFILHVGDYIAVQKLGNNTYIVLSKLQKVENEQ